MVISMFLGLFAAQFVSYMLHYAPQWNLDGKEMNVFQKTVFAYFRYTGFDSMKINENRLYFVTDGGTLSVYTVLIAALIMAVIGMYGAFIFMHIGEKRDAQNESGRKKGKRSRNRRG